MGKIIALIYAVVYVGAAFLLGGTEPGLIALFFSVVGLSFVWFAETIGNLTILWQVTNL